MQHREIPEVTVFTIESVGNTKTTFKGNSYLECRTNVGVVAFWGSRTNQSNIDAVKRLSLPFTVKVACIPPSQSFASSHALWVPERSVLEPSQSAASGGSKTSQSDNAAGPIAIEALAEFRREIVRILSALEPDARSDPSEGVGARISRLVKEGKIPRPIAAMMKAITEMRNAAEYDGADPTNAQSRAVLENRTAVLEWARSQKLTN